MTGIVQSRRSVRKFLPTPLSASDIRGVLEDAHSAPSNRNTQPWTVHVVSGAPRDALSKELLKADEERRLSSDFTFSYSDFGEGTHLDRAHDHAGTLLFMPTFGDGVRVAGDIGMYAQNILLSLAARGLAGIPRTMLGFYADVVREFLGVSQVLKLLFGISFGTADPAAPVNGFRVGRVPLEQSVVLHGTPGVVDEQ